MTSSCSKLTLYNGLVSFSMELEGFSGLQRQNYIGSSFLGAGSQDSYPISRLFRTRRYNRMVKEEKEDMLLLFLAILAVLAEGPPKVLKEGPPNLLGVFKLLALEGSLSRSLGV